MKVEYQSSYKCVLRAEGNTCQQPRDTRGSNYLMYNYIITNYNYN